MTKQLLLPAVALLLALVALLRPMGGGEDGTSAALRSEIAEVQAQLRELRSELTALRHAPASPSLAAPATSGPPALDARLTRIETILEELAPVFERMAAAPGPAPSPGETQGRQVAGSPEEQVAILLDPRLPSSARLDAVKRLRGRGTHLNEDRVVAELLSWLSTEADAEIRADIVRNIGKPTNHRLIDGLVEVLRRDANPTVREEAAETLGKNSAATGVRDALAAAARQDPDAKVRAQAQAGLN